MLDRLSIVNRTDLDCNGNWITKERINDKCPADCIMRGTCKALVDMLVRGKREQAEDLLYNIKQEG